MSVEPSDQQAHVVYIEALKATGRPAELIADGLASMADAVEVFDHGRASELVSLYLEQLHAPDKAAFWLNRFLSIWPNDRSFIEALVRAHAARGAWRECHDVQLILIQVTADEAALVGAHEYAVELSVERLGDLDAAYKHLKALNRLKPDDLGYLLQLDEILTQMVAAPSHVDVLKSRARLQPDDVDCRRRLARLLEGEARLQEAVVEWKVVLGLEPDNREAAWAIYQFCAGEEKAAARVRLLELLADDDIKRIAMLRELYAEQETAEERLKVLEELRRAGEITEAEVSALTTLYRETGQLSALADLHASMPGHRLEAAKIYEEELGDIAARGLYEGALTDSDSGSWRLMPSSVSIRRASCGGRSSSC